MVYPLKDNQTFVKVETLVPETGLKEKKAVQFSAEKSLMKVKASKKKMVPKIAQQIPKESGPEKVTAENVLQHIPAVMANSLLLAETMFDQSTSAAASMIRFPLITVPKKLAGSIFG